MERFQKDGPAVSLTDEQKAQLAEIDSLYQSKIAEKQVFLGDLITKAQATGDFAEVAQLEEQRRREIARLEDKREVEKEKIRKSSS